MSKSRGNVINPDDIVYEYGADSLRLYEMFMGPLTDTKVIQSFLFKMDDNEIRYGAPEVLKAFIVF